MLCRGFRNLPSHEFGQKQRQSGIVGGMGDLERWNGCSSAGATHMVHVNGLSYGFGESSTFDEKLAEAVEKCILFPAR